MGVRGRSVIECNGMFINCLNSISSINGHIFSEVYGWLGAGDIQSVFKYCDKTVLVDDFVPLVCFLLFYNLLSYYQ